MDRRDAPHRVVGLLFSRARSWRSLAAWKSYGYREDQIEATKKRFEEGIALLVKTLGSRDYYLGEKPTALDVYSAASLNTLQPLPNEVCPISPGIRAAFESMSAEYKEMLAPLAAHRDRMYDRHLGLPILN